MNKKGPTNRINGNSRYLIFKFFVKNLRLPFIKERPTPKFKFNKYYLIAISIALCAVSIYFAHQVGDISISMQSTKPVIALMPIP
jgi:hypothetical protein